jgi:hypothetical protein
MKHTVNPKLISAEKGILLIAFLILLLPNVVKAQDSGDNDRIKNINFFLSLDDTIRIANKFRLYITQPTNNIDSIIFAVERYDSTTICKNLKLIKQAYFDEIGFCKAIKYCFTDSNTKFIEETIEEGNDWDCIVTKNPFHLTPKKDDFFQTKPLSEYSAYLNKDLTLQIVKKVFKEGTITIVKKREYSTRFPLLDIIYLDDKLLFINFYEAIY